jgi:hypothetical protein
LEAVSGGEKDGMRWWLAAVAILFSGLLLGSATFFQNIEQTHDDRLERVSSRCASRGMSYRRLNKIDVCINRNGNVWLVDALDEI